MSAFFLLGLVAGLGQPTEPATPQNICGLTASTPAQFRVKVDAEVAAGRLRPMEGSDRFDVFSFTGDDLPLRQWAFSKPGEASYPMATCREVTKVKGQFIQTRGMDCEASQLVCLAILKQFQQVDARAAAALGGK